MRILFYSYPSSFQNVGGGEILLLKLKEYLENAGAQVQLFDMWHDRVEDYDLLHIFGSVKDCLRLAEVAHDRHVKVAITPLFWSTWSRAFFEHGSFRNRVELLLRHATKVFIPTWPSSRRKLMMISDLVFPNSSMEAQLYRRLFAIPPEKMRVVFNGVDRRFQHAKSDLFHETYGKSPFILSVGRIEPRKNQLNLIRAVKKLGQRLVLIGNPVSGYESYYRACREEGASFTQFIPSISHEEPLLASAYAAASLYVLPGWFETPGLVALEAALAGCPVAVTEGGSTREYFGEHAWYFKPSQPNSIAEAIQIALNHPRSKVLRERVLEHFTWESIAQSTLNAYRSVIKRESPHDAEVRI